MTFANGKIDVCANVAAQQSDCKTRVIAKHMTQRFPPLNPLRVFEVVARLQNLTAAADELHVSQSAVSRQIATLESYLGVELFRREHRGVSLTRAGALYAQSVVPAFASIGLATEQLLSDQSHGVLRVRTYTTFAAKWLIPRLPDFHQRHPEVDLVLSNAVPDVDFDRDPVDVAVQFGNGRWPKLQLDKLFDDQIEPVCSPTYLKALPGGSAKLERFHDARLLISHYRSADWNDWLAATDRLHAADHAEQMRFSTSLLTWQAAIDGLGMAIGQTAMLTTEFERHQLVRPFAQPIQRPLAYYLARPSSQRFSRKVDQFRDWILRAAQETQTKLAAVDRRASAFRGEPTS